MTRLKANLEILEIIKKFFKENKDIRFCQGLVILGLLKDKNNPGGKDTFYEESIETLNNLK